MATRPLRHLLTAMALIMMTMPVTSCEDDEQRSYVANVDPRKTPTMTTTGVSTFISDSGFTKYHITTDVWNIYDDLPDPLWTFPTGVNLVNFDHNMAPAATLVCDSATYYSKRRLWRLDGHVVMVNALRDTFLTQQLFWDQNRALVYSDSFIHITKARHVIEGYGFTSNQTMTAYDVNRPTAIIPIQRDGDTPGRVSPVAAPATTTPSPLPGTIDPDDATRTLEARPAAPEPASMRNARRQQFLGSSPNNSSPTATPAASTPPATTSNRQGSAIKRK